MKKLLYSIGIFVFDMCTNNKTTTILIRLTLILAVCAVLSRIVRAITPLIIVIALFGFISCEKPMCYDVQITKISRIYSNGELYQVNNNCAYTETHCNMTYSDLEKWCEWSTGEFPIDNYVVAGCLLDSITVMEYRHYEIIQ